MKNRKQLKDAVHDRREFLLKSASVAGAISVPTLIGFGSLATSGSAIANPTHTSRLYAKDCFPFFYGLTKTAGWADWDYAEVQWTNSNDAMTKSGSLIFYKYWLKSLGLVNETANYSFSFKNVMDGIGKDLDSVQGLSITRNIDTPGGLQRIKLKDQSQRVDVNDLRRRLQYEPNWDADWQIPESWQLEFLAWNSIVLDGLHQFGVYVHQWGDRRYGVAMRALFVYDLAYDYLLGRFVRRATPRRVMYLFGAQIQGQWVNLAIDDIEEAMLPDLNIVGAAVFIAARLAPEFNPDLNVQIPFYGWRNDVGGQHDLGRALLGAIVGQLVGGAGALGVYAVAIGRAQAALARLRDQFPRQANGNYVGGPLRYRGVQALANGNFGVVNVEIDLVNWLAVNPALGWQNFAYVPPWGNEIPQLEEANVFPQVIPNDIPHNDSTNSTEVMSEDSFTLAWRSEINGIPNSNAGRRLRALLSDF